MNRQCVTFSDLMLASRTSLRITSQEVRFSVVVHEEIREASEVNTKIFQPEMGGLEWVNMFKESTRYAKYRIYFNHSEDD